MGNAVTEEYIRRSEALDAIRRFSTENGSVLGYHSGAIDLALEAIEASPAVDAAPVVYGTWLEEDGMQICSNCGEEHEWDDYRASYPKYAELSPTFIGRYAKLATCNPDCVYKDSIGNKFTMEDGKRMVCKEYRSGFLPFGAPKAEVIITLTDDMTVKITDNAQVLDDAVFV